jgi:hypothetical protein
MEDCIFLTRSRVPYNSVAGSGMWTARCKFGHPEQEDVVMYYIAYKASVTLFSSSWRVRQTNTCLAGLLAPTEGEMAP